MPGPRRTPWAALQELAEELLRDLRRTSVSAPAEARGIRRRLSGHFDFREPQDLTTLAERTSAFLARYQVNANHPGYFGLFHPGVSAAGPVGAFLTGLHNPQLATWSHAPGAIELERHVLAHLGRCLGRPEDQHATFTTGGEESLRSAVAVALARAFPDVPARGLRALPGTPVGYTSVEGHEALTKVFASAGLGHSALRRVPVDDQDRLCVESLDRRVQEDRAAGHLPFLVVGTAGTTATGAVDPLVELADLCRAEGLWFHVDAAWAGSACLSSALSGLLRGIERADSVNWDAHKWLWAPLGAGMFFCREREAVTRAFGVRARPYVPRSADDQEDPYATTLQWSRRCHGLATFLTLAHLGEDGVRRRVDQQISMGDLLRQELRDAGWEVRNASPLPLVCFSHPETGEERQAVTRLARRVNQGGRTWVSTVSRPGRTRWLRACVTHPDSGREEVRGLVSALEAARGSSP